jgi:probable F420-dependent oxidoreductase
VKVDASIGPDMRAAAATAAAAARAGYAGIWSFELSHSAFPPLVLAAEHAETLELGTSIVVAFARSPMTTAIEAWDLQGFSGGRLMLGLGSQIRPHIEKRYSMPWSHPAPRMREFIAALRAIWGSWQNGTKLDFRGDFYQHTLMTPMFNPGPLPSGPPKVFLAAVGERMTEVAGEVADGIILHGFTTERYAREVTLPALERGLARSGRSRRDVQVRYSPFLLTADSPSGMERAGRAVRERIAFYASTPAYRPVLDLHGWGDLQPDLNLLSKQGEWTKMGDLIGDEVVDAFAVDAGIDELPERITERIRGIADRTSFEPAVGLGPDRLAAMVARIAAGDGGSGAPSGLG